MNRASARSRRSPAADPAVDRLRRPSRRADVLLLALAIAVTAALLSGAPGGSTVALLLAVGMVAAAAARLVRRALPDAAPVGPDVEALRAARDRAEAEAAALSRRLATVAHEIRTPLHGILGMADLLAETPLTAEQTSHVRAVRTSGAALLGLVDDVLDLTRLEAGRFAVAAAPTDLQVLVEDVVELMAPRARGKGLELASIVAPAVPARVEADPILLRQVLINLVGNAVKYTHRGGVAVEVEAAEGVRGAGRIAFRVRDTGVGIAEADAGRIFAEFERVAPGAEARGGGTGLGLAIARTLVARMGGELRLASRLGEGSVFAFDLRLPAVESRRAGPLPLAGRRLAVVSDGMIEPPLLARRLHALGAEVVQVATAAALDPDESFDVVLVEGDDRAADALAALRRTAAAGSAVVMVDPTDRGRLAEWRRAGFAGHLVKPVRAASLVRVVVALGSGEGLAEGGAEATEGPAPAPTAGLDLLLADDNEINALLGRALLEHLGHRVTVVADGAAAVEEVAAARARGRPFAAVLMDLHMPGMDGFAAIRALRLAETGETPRLTILALTADGTAAAALRARACGADATLVKPIERDRLAALLAPPADGPARIADG